MEEVKILQKEMERQNRKKNEVMDIYKQNTDRGDQDEKQEMNDLFYSRTQYVDSIIKKT